MAFLFDLRRAFLFTLLPTFIEKCVQTGVFLICPGIKNVLIAVIRSTNPEFYSCHLAFVTIVVVRGSSMTLTLRIFSNLNKSV